MLTQVGKYQIVEKIGVGGFGSVYKGRDPFIKRSVAIKTCQSDEEEIKKRFFREAEYAGNLQHRNITTIYDFGVTEEGVPYIVQEFLTGEDLDKKIKRKEPMPLARKVKILVDVCEGLGFAHQSGIIHRDIKPSNIRVLENGTVKIMDFGIAKSMVSQSTLTQTGITLGTASYLAPEQIRGESVDPRTDLFSMGVLAYELLTGGKPFTGDHISTVLYKILNEHPQNPHEINPEVPVELGAAVLHALEKDRTKRPDSCAHFHDELVAALPTGMVIDDPQLSVSIARPSGLIPIPAGVSAPDAGEETISTPTGGLTALAMKGPPPATTPSKPVSIDHAQITPGSGIPTATGRGSLGDVDFRRDDAAPLSAAAPKAEGGGATKVVVAVAALLVVAGVIGFVVMKGRSGAGQSSSPEEPISKTTTTATTATTASPEPTAAPTVAAPTPEPTSAPAPAAPTTGSVVVSSNAYAELTIDGQKHKGVLTAVKIGQLKPGRHKAIFKIEGFPAIEESFEVAAGATAQVRAEFPPRGLLKIQINYEARDAEIRLDGEPIGKAPIKRTVKAGSHRVEASLQGFETVSKTVIVPEEDSYDLKLALPKKAGEGTQ